MRFADYCGDRSLYQVFGDQKPVPISDPKLKWLNLPPASFLDYARQRAPLPNHVNPPDEVNYKKTPTFLIQQVHRHWLTLEPMSRYLRESPNGTLLDLGAFPFAIDLALREYYGLRNRIIATLNFRPDERWVEELTSKQIETAYINLDPMVNADCDLPAMTASLPFADGSIDFVSLAHVIEHLYHPAIALKECFRVLRPSGKFLVSTDNALMVYGLLNFISCNPFLYEPVQGTAAMAFHAWRGHVRFYTEGDLRTMLESIGFRIVETQFCEVLYSSIIEEYFKFPAKDIPAWKADLLTAIPDFRNEIILIAEKPV